MCVCVCFSYCISECSRRGGGGLSYSHVSYMRPLMMLSPPLHPDYPSTSLLGHSSPLAKGHRKQHKLSIQLQAPQKIWQEIRTYAMIKSPFIPGPSTILSLLRAEGGISPRWCVCVLRESQLLLYGQPALLQFLGTMPSPSDDNRLLCHV